MIIADLRWTVTAVLDGDKPKRLADARVTVMTDEAKGIGVEVMTDRYGRATFQLSDKVRVLDAVYVDPLHSGWPVALTWVPLAPGGMQVGVPRIEDGHGSHVAGVIAASAAGWRRGEASAVKLRAYRIFEAGDPYASTFAIQAAIKQAALDGSDLINLSIGDSMADAAVHDAVRFAWERGSVCVAATGNDGRGQVDYPARYPEAVAVSAIGLEKSWPAGAFFEWTLSPHRGQAIGGHVSFLAGFSNRGTKVALTAPGVAVLSTIFGGRWGRPRRPGAMGPHSGQGLPHQAAAKPTFAAYVLGEAGLAQCRWDSPRPSG